MSLSLTTAIWRSITSDGLNRQPFNADNPDGPLELCTCADCGAPIMVNDKERRVRVIVPNLMGYDPAEHAGDLSCLLRSGER